MTDLQAPQPGEFLLYETEDGRTRDIRASERRMYLRVREIFAMAADYSPTLPETTRFFRFIQKKLHFAAPGNTAAELIAERADSRLYTVGRIKDILVASTGKKIPPADLEQAIESDALFAQVLVVVDPAIWARETRGLGVDTADSKALHSQAARAWRSRALRRW